MKQKKIRNTTSQEIKNIHCRLSWERKTFQSSFFADPKKDMRASMLSAWDISGKGFPVEAEAGAGC